MSATDHTLTARLTAVEAERDEWRRVVAEQTRMERERAEQAEAERDRLAAAVERVEALADDWSSVAEGWMCNSCGSDNFPVCTHADDLRAVLSDAGRGK